MSIIGSLPVDLANGTTADASQVMTDLNFIINAVNANAQPAGSYVTTGTLSAPSGTRTIFHQATAPTGWVTDTTVSNHSVILNPPNAGAVYSAGTGYLNFINGTWSSGGHALLTAEIPAHTHSFASYSGAGGNSGPQTTTAGNTQVNTTDGGTGGGQAHVHPMSSTWNCATCVIAQKS